MKKEIKDELKEISSFLSEIQKPPVPKVPEQYFEGFEKSPSEQRSKESWFSTIFTYFTKPAIALSFGVLALLLIMTKYISTDTATRDIYADELAQVDKQELLSYIDSHIDQYDTEILLDDNTDLIENFDTPYPDDIPDTL
mgnify:CR=1 FL=1